MAACLVASCSFLQLVHAWVLSKGVTGDSLVTPLDPGSLSLLVLPSSLVVFDEYSAGLVVRAGLYVGSEGGCHVFNL